MRYITQYTLYSAVYAYYCTTLCVISHNIQCCIYILLYNTVRYITQYTVLYLHIVRYVSVYAACPACDQNSINDDDDLCWPHSLFLWHNVILLMNVACTASRSNETQLFAYHRWVRLPGKHDTAELFWSAPASSLEKWVNKSNFNLTLPFSELISSINLQMK